MENEIFIIDGTSYIYRSFHALPPMFNSKNYPIWAILGFANMILKLIKKDNIFKFIIVFDGKGKTHRHKIFKEYKANRPKMPQNLKLQIKYIHAFVKNLGIKSICINGTEADDIIGAITKQIYQYFKKIYIYTLDKDIYQLVDKKINLINPKTNEIIDEYKVIKKFNITASLIPDYLSLTGDSSDNIPGIPGIGAKTAAKLLNEFGAINEIIKNIDSLNKKNGENIYKNIEQLKLAKKLATINRDVEIPDLSIAEKQNFNKLDSILDELEISSIKFLYKEKMGINSCYD